MSSGEPLSLNPSVVRNKTYGIMGVLRMGHLVVAVDELSQLVGQDASAVLKGKLATGQSHLHVLLKVTGGSLQEANHQLLDMTNIQREVALLLQQESLIRHTAVIWLLVCCPFTG